jgi:hypothetical protein
MLQSRGTQTRLRVREMKSPTAQVEVSSLEFLSIPNHREFSRKYGGFAPRGAFQARNVSDCSPFLAKPGICRRRKIAL